MTDKTRASPADMNKTGSRAVATPDPLARPTTLHLRPRVVLKGLLVINALLIGISATAELVRYSFIVRQAEIPQPVHRIIQLVDVNLEVNIPAWYSTVAIMVCAILLAIIARATPPTSDRRHWWGLSVIFAILSLDELASLHESTISVLQRLFNTSGLFALAWVIPGILFVAIVALIYIPFLRRLPQRTRGGFLLAGALFVAGSLGFEMIGAWYSEQPGMHYLVYAALWTVEEALELLGISVFIFELLRYMADRPIPLAIPLRPPKR